MTAKTRTAIAASITALLALGASACSSATGGGDSADSDQLSVVGFSVLETANEPVFADFEETDAGKDVTFKTSYGASGDQSRAVEGGLDADVVHFSLEPDIQRLVDAGLVADDWNDNPTKGIATSSVVVVRGPQGQPGEHPELGRPGQAGRRDHHAQPRVLRLREVEHPRRLGPHHRQRRHRGRGEGVRDADARQHHRPAASAAATRPPRSPSGNGDVLLSYENESILARPDGEDFDYVVPDDTLLIENPAAVTATPPTAAQDFLDFLISPEAQAVYAMSGFRPVIDGVDIPEVEGANDPSNPFPTPQLYTIDDDFGGWDKANTSSSTRTTASSPQLQAETGNVRVTLGATLDTSSPGARRPGAAGRRVRP